MCGFLAYIGENVDQVRFGAALATIAHRGPDSTQIFNSLSYTFGFNRLAIQDLSEKSMQPMVDIYKNSIIYNGEVYNFKELRKELENLNYIFNTTGDVEVIMKSFLEWGFEKSLAKFEGMFSIVYFSKKENKVYVGRDFFGIKPLFYLAISDKEIIIASEIKAIIKYNKKAEIDYLSSLNPFFFNGMPPKGKTMFKDIKSLNGGDIISINLNNNDFKIKNIFSIESLVDEDLYNEISSMNEENISKIYHKELEKSVKLHMVSDAKCGVLFSAGLDSSLVAGIINNLGEEIDLFKFENNNNSDKIYSDIFLKYSNQTLHQVENVDDLLIFDLPRMIYHYETVNKKDGVALARACKLSRENGYKSLLTGDCADEIFAGYTTAQDYFTKSNFKNNKLFINSTNFLNKVIPGFDELFGADLSHFINPYKSDLFETFFDVSLHGGEKKLDINKYRNAYHFINSKKEIYSNSFMMDEVSNRLERFLIRSDRFGMMESIELRIPFLTNSIVKLAVNTPYHKKTKFQVNWKSKSFFSNKTILKNVAQRVGIPKDIINRRKVGTIISENNLKNEIKLFKTIPLSNVSSFLNINENTLKESVLVSKAKAEVQKQIWNFIALEFLIDQFVNGNSYFKQEEKIRQLLN